VRVLGAEPAQQRGHDCQALTKRLPRHEQELFQYVLLSGL